MEFVQIGKHVCPRPGVRAASSQIAWPVATQSSGGAVVAVGSTARRRRSSPCAQSTAPKRWSRVVAPRGLPVRDTSEKFTICAAAGDAHSKAAAESAARRIGARGDTTGDGATSMRGVLFPWGHSYVVAFGIPAAGERKNVTVSPVSSPFSRRWMQERNCVPGQRPSARSPATVSSHAAISSRGCRSHASRASCRARASSVSGSVPGR